MKSRVLQENISKALSKASRILSSKPQLPILNNVLLVGDKDGLRITSTSLDITESTLVGAKIEKDGGACVPGKLLTELIASLPPEPVDLTADANVLHIACAGTHATIPGVSVSEFPPITILSDNPSVPLDKKTMIPALASVLFAAATDDTRPMFTGVKIEKDGSDLLFVATDGFRLSLKKAPGTGKEFGDVVVPARALSEIVKIATEEKSDTKASMRLSADRQIIFTLGTTDVACRLLDGEYPIYRKIIPARHTTRTHFDKAALAPAVKSAALFARDNANIIRLSISGQKVSVSANTPNVGENTVEVEAQVDGEGGTIAFNSRFLLDMLNNFPEDELLFEMTGSLNPGVFRPVKDDSFLHIIMPVRVQS